MIDCFRMTIQENKRLVKKIDMIGTVDKIFINNKHGSFLTGVVNST